MPENSRQVPRIGDYARIISRTSHYPGVHLGDIGEVFDLRWYKTKDRVTIRAIVSEGPVILNFGTSELEVIGEDILGSEEFFTDPTNQRALRCYQRLKDV